MIATSRSTHILLLTSALRSHRRHLRSLALSRILTIAVSVFAFLGLLSIRSQAAGGPLELRVGITEYQRIDSVYKRYSAFFRDVEEASNSQLRFSIAIGTYDEVLRWRDRGDVDLSVLSAGPVITLLSLGNTDDRQELVNAYLGHLAYVSSALEGSSLVTQLNGVNSEVVDGYYRAACVVRNDSPFHNFADIIRAANERNSRVKFLFVRPYSVSGYIHPRYVLENNGLRKDQNKSSGIDAEFKQQHSYSLEALLTPVGDDIQKDLVAFVLEGTSFDASRIADLRRIPMPELDNMNIPQEGLFLNTRLPPAVFDHTKTLLLTALKKLQRRPNRNCDATKNLVCFDTSTPALQWIASYDALVREAKTVALPPNLQVRGVLDDLVNELDLYRHHVKEPRVALVLSGGGAKCAYQVGALSAIGEHFKDLRIQQKWVPDVGLVVGTSGGAVNALFYALGLDNNLETTWMKFDQKDFIRPSAVTQILWGMCVALSCVLSVLIVSLLLFGTRWWIGTAVILALFCVGLIICSQLALTALHNHWLYHDIFLLKLSIWSGSITLTVGALLVINHRVRDTIKNRLALVNIIGGVCLLALILFIGDSLLYNEYLTDLSGVKKAFVDNFPSLLPGVHTRVAGMKSVDQQLEAISKTIIDSGLNGIKHDLILTASRLPADNRVLPTACGEAVSGSSLPSDLYFYYDIASNKRLPSSLPNKGDKRFISLRENPTKLLHVVLGSSTIYPFFGSQRLDCLVVGRPESSQSNPQLNAAQKIRSIDIVDGGFSHNSPLEAAISWGATHILLIQASPIPRQDRPTSFAGNMLNAADYLFDQAQRGDSGVRGNVEIFELAPSFACDEWFAPQCADERGRWLDLLDFASPLLRSAIDHGKSDVNGKPLKPVFTRIPGPPSFIPVSRDTMVPGNP